MIDGGWLLSLGEEDSIRGLIAAYRRLPAVRFAAVKESKERVRAALKNTGFDFPLKQVVVNLAPADIKKEGSAFDLPIAVGMLIAEGVITQEQASGYLIVGELALDGRVKPVREALAATQASRAALFPMVDANFAGVRSSRTTGSYSEPCGARSRCRGRDGLARVQAHGKLRGPVAEQSFALRRGGADAPRDGGDRLLVRLGRDALRPVGLSESTGVGREVFRSVSRRLHQ